MDSKQVYNGLDVCLTWEVFDVLTRTHGTGPNAPHQTTYDFERALQAPYLGIMRRGLRVDESARRSAVATLQAKLAHLGSIPGEHDSGVLQQLSRAVWDKGLNPRSTDQLRKFFYEVMRLPEITISQKGVRKLAMNREVLEKLEIYLYAKPIVATILAIRDYTKQLQVFETEIDPDGRWRTSYNIAGTETGRPSSSGSSEGTGGNLQNIDPALRFVFVADEGYKFCAIDASQSEARDVGFLQGCLFGDWKFLDSCESGDLHTANSRLIWPELPWTGELKLDKEIAEKDFYYGFSYRDMAKRGGHLTNYYGTAWTAARSLKVPLSVTEAFQAKYKAAFPAFPRWWAHTRIELQTKRRLVTPFGFARTFFGRPEADETLREAIAFVPQSMTAQRVNLGLYRIWRDLRSLGVQLLGNGFDSVLFQYPEEAEGTIVPKAIELMENTPLFAPSGRRFVVPMEAKVGWNWMDHHSTSKALGPDNKFNPNGLLKWKGERETRKRLEGLDKPIM